MDSGEDRTALSSAGNALLLLGQLKNGTQGSGLAGGALSKRDTSLRSESWFNSF